MKIQQLKYFIEVCNYGTITEAANNLFVSQPSITAAIKELEADLGVNLFKRINKKLFITKEGELFLAKAVDIVKDIDELKNQIQDMANLNKVIRLGIPAQTGSFLLPIIFGEFYSLNPEVKIEITEAGSYDLIELLEKDQIDLMLMAHLDEVYGNFKYIKLYDSEFCFITHSKNKLADKKNIEISDLVGEKLVLLNRSYVVTKTILKCFDTCKIKPDIMFITNHLFTVKNLVQSGIASSILLKESVIHDENCVAIPLNPPLNVPVSILIKKEKIIFNDLEKIMKFLKEKLAK